MKAKNVSLMFAAATALLVVSGSVSAQSGKPASIELTLTSIAAGLTGGSGVLHLPTGQLSSRSLIDKASSTHFGGRRDQGCGQISNHK